MNQPQQSPRYILKIILKDAAGIKDLDFEFNVPTTQPVPLPNDEIQIPKEVAERNQLKGNVLRVKERRFILDALPIGITGIIYLVVE